MIEIVNLTKKFGKVTAIEDLSLDIKKGELFGIVGPNGAGKTTIVRVLCGALKPTKGGIKVNGYDIVKDPIKVKSNLGYLPEEPSLYERLTATKLLEFFGRLYGVDDLDSRIPQLLKFVGLYERADSKISTFSKGMRQRLAIARTLLNDPPILILDEPTMGLDPGTARSIREFILEQKGKKTILLCTHYMDEAEMLCDRIAILNNGRVAAVGTPADLKNEVARTEGVEGKEPSMEDVFVHFTKDRWIT
ncbi:MAG: ABC transporter ATP-binding protein [Candidatus Hydrothermarchaeales archaeon]